MTSMLDTNRIAIIGVPSSAGARMAGQEQGPKSLRDAGLVQCLRDDGHEVLDLGDTDTVTYAPDEQHPTRQNLDRVVAVVEQVRHRVDAAVAEKAWPLVLGGDCTITIGVLASLTQRFPNLGLMYLDGDVDMNTPETTFTGIFDGMVIAHILGEGAEELSRFGSRYPLMRGQHISLFGYSPEAGGLDPVEKELLKSTRMAKYPYKKVKGAITDAAIEALRELENNTDHILVHFDIDVIGEKDFPGVDVPHTPGLTLEQAGNGLAVFLQSEKTIGLVVTEFNPNRDPNGKCASNLTNLIREAKRHQGRTGATDLLE